MLRGIVLISIDCLRADHLSCYGYSRPTTPTLDALAARGALWERAYATSSWTKPSVSSLLTGLYPSQHRSFQGIKRSKGQTTVTTDVLRSTEPTLAESFSAIGWRCGAFINNAQLGEFSRLDRGFDAYLPNAGKADRLLEHYGDWLNADPQRPAFAYLHFLEAHWPYKPRRRHIASFGGNRDSNIYRDYSARDFGRLRRSIAHSQATLTDDELGQMIQMYDGAVRRLDGKVKRVLELLDRAGLAERTAVIVTADHGEEFLDHGRIGHGHSLYEELTHVPLIAAFPDGPCGVRFCEPISHVDLAATLLSAAGSEPGLAGCDLLAANAKPRPVISELLIGRRYLQALVEKRWKLHRGYKFDRSANQDVRQATPRQLFDTCAHQRHVELYDLQADPDERVNLYEDPGHLTVRDDMINRLDRWWGDVTSHEDPDTAMPVELEPATVERLRALGYLD